VLLVLVNVRTEVALLAVTEAGAAVNASDVWDETVPDLGVRESVTPAGMLLNVSRICEPALIALVGPVELLPL